VPSERFATKGIATWHLRPPRDELLRVCAKPPAVRGRQEPRLVEIRRSNFPAAKGFHE
jgi:hypothetical protein